MLRLTEEIEDKIRVLFTDAEEINWLKEFFGRERLPPMVSPPLARPMETPDLGGYRTKGMHARKPLVSDTEGRQHLSRARFLPSAEAIGVINSLQTTTWKVDKYEPHDNQPNDTYSVVKEVLEHEIKSNILKHLTIEEKMEIWCYHLRTSNRTSAKFERTGSASGWTRSDLSISSTKNSLANLTFGMLGNLTGEDA